MPVDFVGAGVVDAEEGKLVCEVFAGCGQRLGKHMRQVLLKGSENLRAILRRQEVFRLQAVIALPARAGAHMLEQVIFGRAPAPVGNRFRVRPAIIGGQLKSGEETLGREKVAAAM